MRIGSKKLKAKKICYSFLQVIFAAYFAIFVLIFYFLISSSPSWSDIFSTNHVSVLKNRPSEIKKDIIVDVALLDTNGGIDTLTKNLVEKIAQKRPEWRLNILFSEITNKKLLEVRSLPNVNMIRVNPWYNKMQEALFEIINFATFGIFRNKFLQIIFYDTIFLDSSCNLFWDPVSGDCVNDFIMPKITTIHDIGFIDYPEMAPPTRSEWVKKRNKKTVKFSDKIVTVSEFSKKRIVAEYKLNDNFVQAIPIRLGKRLNQNLSAEDINLTLKKFNIVSKEYVIFVSQFYKHKNHERLIQAFSKFIKNNQNSNFKKIKLLIVGNMVHSRGEIQKFAEKYKTDDNIIFTGMVSNKDLQTLMSQALFFIHPSLYEGFGMPIIEAMDNGIPVTCSNAASLPEVAGDAALFFNPEDVDSIESAIKIVTENSNLRQQLIERGHEHAQKFTNTNEMADEYIKLFEKTMR